MDDKSLAAAALTAVVVWEVVRCYTSNAPSLSDLRDSAYEVQSRQKLLDADMMVGGVALMAGVAASWLSRSWIPFVLVAGVFAYTSGYHHLVLKGSTPDSL